MLLRLPTPPPRSPKDNPKFDAMGEALYPDLHRNCRGFMRHKVRGCGRAGAPRVTGLPQKACLTVAGVLPRLHNGTPCSSAGWLHLPRERLLARQHC